MHSHCAAQVDWIEATRGYGSISAVPHHEGQDSNPVSIQGTKTASIGMAGEWVLTLGLVASIVARPSGDEFNFAGYGTSECAEVLVLD